MTQNTQIDQKIINNAISAYLMLFISGAFLLNTDNIYINNSFVKSHTKRALLLHIIALFSYIVFISNSFLIGISLFGYNLNSIIASTIFLIVLAFMLYGMYKAQLGEAFHIKELILKWEKKKIILSQTNNKLKEQEKLTFILGFIPFIWYIINGSHSQNNTIKNIIFINQVSSVFIMCVYLFWYTNLSVIFGLIYLIYWVFSSINLVVNNSIFLVNFKRIYSMEDAMLFVKSICIYLKKYFWKQVFSGFRSVYEWKKEQRISDEKYNEKLLEEKKDTSIPKIIIYIPFINLIFLFLRQSKYRFHIINWLMITLLFILCFILQYFHVLWFQFHVLLFFPMFFWIGFLHSRPAYKMPFIYDVFESLTFTKKKIIASKQAIQKKHNEEHSENIIVK